MKASTKQIEVEIDVTIKKTITVESTPDDDGFFDWGDAIENAVSECESEATFYIEDTTNISVRHSEI